MFETPTTNWNGLSWRSPAGRNDESAPVHGIDPDMDGEEKDVQHEGGRGSKKQSRRLVQHLGLQSLTKAYICTPILRSFARGFGSPAFLRGGVAASWLTQRLARFGGK